MRISLEQITNKKTGEPSDWPFSSLIVHSSEIKDRLTEFCKKKKKKS